MKEAEPLIAKGAPMKLFFSETGESKSTFSFCEAAGSFIRICCLELSCSIDEFIYSVFTLVTLMWGVPVLY
jgi:hypothetical protein